MRKRIHLLLVEDDEDDRFLLCRAFERVHGLAKLHTATDGVQAQDLLKSAEGKCVDLVITDVKMPKCDGFELLQWIRAGRKTDCLPVVILSSSAQESDVLRAYRLGANTYFQKPVHHGELQKWTRTLVEYWGAMAEIPA